MGSAGSRILQIGPFGGGRGVDTGVSVLAVILRFTIWVLLILAAVWIVREVLTAIHRARAAGPRAGSAAVAELDMLYARGEVTRTDYLARRADLVGLQPPAPTS
jgi:uncharacterized membrane protein